MGAPTLERLYWQYARYVGWFATRLLGDPSDVDDLVQDVFVIAARHLGSVRSPERVRHWLAKITIRQASWRLRQRRMRALLGLSGDGSAALDQAIAPGAAQDSIFLLREVFRALDKLPSKQRVAWFLRHVETEKLEDAAEISGCSLTEFKRRLRKAEARMSVVLGHE